MCRRGTKAWAYHLDFQSENFPYAFFNVKKQPLYVNFSIYFVQIDVFFKVPYTLWIWDFVDIYLTHLGTRIWSPSIHIYFIKWFFWPPKLCSTPWAQGKNLFFSTLNLVILQTVWNECVRFGGHINIKVSYKNFAQSALFWREVFLRQFWTQHGHWCLGVKKRNPSFWVVLTTTWEDTRTWLYSCHVEKNNPFYLIFSSLAFELIFFSIKPTSRDFSILANYKLWRFRPLT
jgi:hypothetical protein